MSACAHASGATLLYAYGEGDEGHAEHIARCEDCQRVLAEHEELSGLLAPALPSASRAPVPMERPQHAGGWVALGLLVAAAAALTLFARPVPVPVPDVDDDVVIEQVAYRAMDLDGWAMVLDEDLDVLDLEIDALMYDLSTL
jgi:hypothetical protein